MDRTYHSLASQVDYDAMVTADLWITGMSVYLRGTIEEKIDFCFRVYDIDMNQEISRPVTTLCPPTPRPLSLSPSPSPSPSPLSFSFFLSFSGRHRCPLEIAPCCVCADVRSNQP